MRDVVEMATSLLRFGEGKVKVARNHHVDKSLEKVRAKTWASPLGTALEVSSKVVSAVEGFVPGANIIKGALAFGATLLNLDDPSIEDLQKDLRDIKSIIEGTNSRAIKQVLEMELDTKTTLPIREVKIEFQDLRGDMTEIFVDIRESNNKHCQRHNGPEG